MELQDLASELLVHILSFLDYKDVLRCGLVSRKMKDVIDDSLLLKYKMELACCGMMEGVEGHSTRSVPIVERYTKLLLFDARWRALAWRRHETLQMRDSTSLWELYGGVLATGTPIEGDLGHWRMEFREMEASGRRDSETDVVHWGFEVDLPLVELALDPSQDLLLLLIVPETPERTLSIHIRSLTTNELHPSAFDGGVLRYEPPATSRSHNLFDRRLRPWFATQICGQHLGLFVFSEGWGEDEEESEGQSPAHLVVWNWKTGQRVANLVGLRGLVNFAFLTPRYILVSRLGNVQQAYSPVGVDNRLNGFGIADSGTPHQPSLDVYDLMQFKPGSTQRDTSFARRYLLPNVKSTSFVQMVRIYTELTTPLHPSGLQSESVDENDNACVGTGAPSLFTISPHSRVISVRIVLAQRSRYRVDAVEVNWRWQGPTQEYLLLIPISTLFHNTVPGCSGAFSSEAWSLDKYVQLGSPPSLLVKTIAWRDWGPKGSRLIAMESPTDFFDLDRGVYPYGPRCAIPLRLSQEGQAPSKYRMRLLNVDRLAVQRFVHKRGERDLQVTNGNHSFVKAVVGPSIIPRGDSYFERDVTTSLPYLETQTSEDTPFECDCFMLTEDSIFTVKSKQNCYNVEIYSF